MNNLFIIIFFIFYYVFLAVLITIEKCVINENLKVNAIRLIVDFCIEIVSNEHLMNFVQGGMIVCFIIVRKKILVKLLLLLLINFKKLLNLLL